MLKEGSILGGTYRVVRHLATGGQSRVYLVKRATDRGMYPLWIAKEVRTDGVFQKALALDMLQAEIDVLRRLEHPGLMRIDDAVSQDGHLYMIAEYIDGETLEEEIRQRGALPEKEVYDIALLLCDVLGYLHSRRHTVLYRDLKPANVMRRADGSVVLIDFGTAMLAGRACLTDNTPMGTKGYSAPEQYDGTARLYDGTDVYALGMTLIALASGGKTSLRAVRGLSPAFFEILKGCTRRSRAKRYRSVAEVYVALRNGKPRVNGRRVRAEVQRKRRLSEINGAFRIGSRAQTGYALSYGDIEIPLDDPMTDVRIGLDTNAVHSVKMDGFTLERDVMVSMREGYTAGF